MLGQGFPIIALNLLHLSSESSWLFIVIMQSCLWTQRSVVASMATMTWQPMLWKKGFLTLKCWAWVANACWHWMCQTPRLVVICGRRFWTNFHPSQAFSWLCPILQGLRWMKVWNSKGLGVKGHRCRLPTSPSICWLFGVLPTDIALRMKSSPLMGLHKWQGLPTRHLLCWTTCPTAFTG